MAPPPMKCIYYYCNRSPISGWSAQVKDEISSAIAATCNDVRGSRNLEVIKDFTDNAKESGSLPHRFTYIFESPIQKANKYFRQPRVHYVVAYAYGEFKTPQKGKPLYLFDFSSNRDESTFIEERKVRNAAQRVERLG